MHDYMGMQNVMSDINNLKDIENDIEDIEKEMLEIGPMTFGDPVVDDGAGDHTSDLVNITIETGDANPIQKPDDNILNSATIISNTKKLEDSGF